MWWQVYIHKESFRHSFDRLDPAESAEPADEVESVRVTGHDEEYSIDHESSDDAEKSNSSMDFPYNL